MVVFAKLESNREYRNKLLLINEEEKQKKNLATINAVDFFRINERRFVLMRSILKPILLKLQQEMIVKALYFSEGNDDELCLNIEFLDDEREGRIILDNSDYNDDVEFVFDSSNGKYNQLIKNNQRMIATAFKEGLDVGLNESIKVMSTSEEFWLTMNLYKFLLENKSKVTDHYIKILYQYYRNDGKLPFFECSSNYPEINNFLQDNTNLKEYLSHIKFYEKDVPLKLIKKR